MLLFQWAINYGLLKKGCNKFLSRLCIIKTNKNTIFFHLNSNVLNSFEMVKWFVLACNTPNLTRNIIPNLMHFFFVFYLFYLLCKIFSFFSCCFFWDFKLPWKCLNAIRLRQSKQNKNNFAHIIIICDTYIQIFF